MILAPVGIKGDPPKDQIPIVEAEIFIKKCVFYAIKNSSDGKRVGHLGLMLSIFTEMRETNISQHIKKIMKNSEVRKRLTNNLFLTNYIGLCGHFICQGENFYKLEQFFEGSSFGSRKKKLGMI